ncbi:MAG: transporter substrate-binding protein [Bacillota bacterium]|nr:transporter substrate-binding protein [Bacillota bacterium]
MLHFIAMERKGEKAMKKVVILLGASLMLSVFMAGCSVDKTNGVKVNDESALPEKIIIGVFEPLTGTNAADGKLEKQGIDLAHKLYPNVTIDGKEMPVELRYVDNKSDKIESENAAKKLVYDFGSSIVLGSWGSSNSIAAGPIFKEAQVPAIGTSCTNPLVTFGNDYYFRVCFNDPFQGKVMANYAFKEGGYRKIAVIQEESSIYSVSLVKLFTENFKLLTGDENSVLNAGRYNTGDNDFTVQLTAIKDSDAQAIFFPGSFTESALIMKQARQLGITLPFLGGDTWENPEIIRLAGEAAEGAVYSGFYDSAAPLTDRGAEFLDAFAAEYGKDEVPVGVSALGFDAYLLAIETIEKAATAAGPTLRDTLAATKDFEGATGLITLDENGDAVKPAVIKSIQGGQFVYKSFVEPY